MALNPEWPLIEEAVSFLNGPNTQLLAYLSIPGGSFGLYQPAEGGIWCDLTARTEGTWTSRRGRQYELDQVQAGAVTTTYRNDDGMFDPENAASPLYPNVDLYRAYRRRAMYPASKNLLYRDTAAGGGGIWGFYLPSWTTPNSTYPLTPGGALLGINTIPATIPANTPVWTVGGFAVAAGLAYSGQGVCYMPSGSSVQMAAQFNWYLANGTITTTVGASTTCPGNIGTRVTVSGTAPANCIGATLSFIIVTPPASTQTITDIAYLQVEQAAAPTAYAQPTWYDLFTGYVERWPQSWQDGGNYGLSTPQVVDAFGYLSQVKILSPGYMESLAAGASWYWPLDEPTNTTVWNDLVGNSNPAQLLLTNGGTTAQCISGQQLPASGVTSGSASGGIIWRSNGLNPGGISGPCTQFANYGAGGAALLDIGTAKGYAGPPAATGWTMTFFVYLPLSTTALNDQTVWAAYDSSGGTNQLLQLRATTLNFYEFDVRPAAGTTYTLSVAPSPYVGCTAFDGSWHVITVTMSADGKTLTGYLDDLGAVTLTNATDMRPAFPAGSRETLGGRASATGAPINGLSGYLACVGYVPTTLPGSGLINIDQGPPAVDYYYDPASVAAIHYSMTLNTGTGYWGITTPAFRNSGARYRDVLRWAGWRGLRAIDNYTSGETQNYGPPSEMLSSASGGGTDAISAAQSVVDTDNGEHFTDRSGFVTFHRRGYRYNQATPAVTFGENAAAGEIPYTTAGFDFDPTRIANDAQLTQTLTSVTYRKTNPGSIQRYGDLPLQRNLNTLDVNEIFDAQDYLLNALANPSQRVESIMIDVAGYPAAWPALLSLELGTPVQVMRRPPNAPATQFQGFVESIAWSMNGDSNAATCTLEISPNRPLQQAAAVFDTSRFSETAGTITLSATSSATTINLVIAAGNPTYTTASAAYPLTIQADAEQIVLTAPPSGSTSPQTFTAVTRGANGTTPAAHAGAVVTLVPDAVFAY